MRRLASVFVVVVRGSERYDGFDRRPWEVLGDAFYDGRLSTDQRDEFLAMRAESGWVRWDWTVDRARATRLLAASRKLEPASELVALWSPWMESVVGAQHDRSRGELLGVDVLFPGQWSILGAARWSPSLAASLGPFLNEHGLVSDPGLERLIEAIYRADPRVEPAGDGRAEAIHVWRVPEGGAR